MEVRLVYIYIWQLTSGFNVLYANHSTLKPSPEILQTNRHGFGIQESANRGIYAVAGLDGRVSGLKC